jgi:hypothetical protein
MFPIATLQPGSTGQVIRLCSSVGRFWISDISTLHETFNGQLPLLDNTAPGQTPGGGPVSDLYNIFKYLDIENKLLSNAVRYEYLWDVSDQYFDSKLTDEIKDKISFIHRYGASPSWTTS